MVTELQSNLFADQFSWAGHLYIQPTKSDWEVMAQFGTCRLSSNETSAPVN